MPSCLARNATPSGCARARSSSSAGAVVRRRSSAERSLAAVRVMTLRNASTFRARSARASPLATSSANSLAMPPMSWLLSASRQLMTALHMPSTASMASRASAPGRMLPSAMPARITCSKKRSMRRLLRPMRRRLASAGSGAR